MELRSISNVVNQPKRNINEGLLTVKSGTECKAQNSSQALPYN